MLSFLQSRVPPLLRTRPTHLISAACMILIGCVQVGAESPSAEPSRERPTVVIELAGIDRAYADVKVAFDLAGDAEGYDILKATIDLFLGGVDRGSPCHYRIFATPGGLQTATSLPVTTSKDFNKFLKYLWDVDVKTAPVPDPGSIGRVPAAVRAELQSLKLQPNERIIFSLMDGFARHDGGYVHLAESLPAVRLATHQTGICANGAVLSMRIDGAAATSVRRQVAFQKSSQKRLAELTKDEGVTEADFAFQRAMLASQLAELEVLFSETLQLQLDVFASEKLKQLKIKADLTPAPGTSLASEVQGVGKAVDAFAGVSRQGAVLSCSFNLPINPAVGKSLSSMVQTARLSIREKLQHASDNDIHQIAADTEFADFVLDVAEQVVAMSDCHGVLRIWSNGNGTLTTVGAVRVGNDTRFEERIQKIKSRTSDSTIGDSKVPIHKIPVHHWSREFAELFDRDKTVLVAIEKDRIWYAWGSNAGDRLEQAVREAGDKVGARSETAIDFHAEMQPLSEVWNKIHVRRSGAGQKSVKKSKASVRPSVANWASIIDDLNLLKIATEAYQQGHDSISVSLKREGDNLSLAAQFDEGTLRFIGKALSTFVKNNLN